MYCLRRLLGIAWKDGIKNSVLTQARIPSLNALLKLGRMRLLGIDVAWTVVASQRRRYVENWPLAKDPRGAKIHAT